jgi:hypothetical protein
MCGKIVVLCGGRRMYAAAGGFSGDKSFVGKQSERSHDLTHILPTFFFLADVAHKRQRRGIRKNSFAHLLVSANEC